MTCWMTHIYFVNSFIKFQVFFINDIPNFFFHFILFHFFYLNSTVSDDEARESTRLFYFIFIFPSASRIKRDTYVQVAESSQFTV